MKDYHRLVYEPTPHVDRLGQGNQSGLTPVNTTLARRMVQNGVYEFYFHANSKITALVNSRGSNAAFKLIRLRRQWTGKLIGSPPGPLATNYELATAISGPGGFGADYGESSWFDTPGERLTGRSTLSYRALQEFVAGVGEMNKPQSPVAEFGGMYYLTAIDITPTKYKIWMSLEKRLTPDEIKRAMGPAGPAAIVGTGPPDFASFRWVPTEWEDYAQWMS